MKKISTAFIALWLLGPEAALAADNPNSITVSGTIQNTSCTVSTDTANQTVFLGDISSKQFYQSGASSQPVQFIVDLQNCTGSMSGVTVTFNGQTDSVDPSLLALDSGDNAASGLGIAILDVNRTLIPLNNPSSNYAIDINDTDNQLVFYAQYRSTASTVNAGSTAATATFDLTYQ